MISHGGDFAQVGQRDHAVPHPAPTRTAPRRATRGVGAMGEVVSLRDFVAERRLREISAEHDDLTSDERDAFETYLRSWRNEMIAPDAPAPTPSQGKRG